MGCLGLGWIGFTIAIFQHFPHYARHLTTIKDTLNGSCWIDEIGLEREKKTKVDQGTLSKRFETSAFSSHLCTTTQVLVDTSSS